MSLRHVLVAVAGCLAVTAPALAQTPAGVDRPGSTLPQADPRADAAFVRQALRDGMAEVRMGQLALDRSSSDEVRLTAQKVVRDHKQADVRLMTLAARRQITRPDGPGPAAQARIARLQALRGDAFDRAYATVLVEDHRKAIEQFDTESRQGKDADLRAFATTTLPILRTHLNMALALRKGKSAGSLQGPGDRGSLNHADGTPLSANGRTTH